MIGRCSRTIGVGSTTVDRLDGTNAKDNTYDLGTQIVDTRKGKEKPNWKTQVNRELNELFRHTRAQFAPTESARM